MFKSLKDIDNLLKKHMEYRKSCLNLIASENYSSEIIRSYLTSDLGNRYGCYNTLDPSDREYTGNKYIHEIEMATHELVKDVFGGKYADLRPISGHMAGMAVVLGILEPNDLVIEVHLKDWGHGLVDPMRQIPHLGQTIRVEFMRFDENNELDVEHLKKMSKELMPKLIIFGGSGTLFPEPVREFRQIADELGIILAYDASHVTGLIAGKVFPNPLEEGVDILFGSTHKSFPGPQGGFIITNRKDLIEKIGNTLSPSLVTSHHLNRIPALAASLLEMKEYGHEYGKQIIKNSKALAKAMAKRGFNVLGAKRGYTETHLILVDVGEYVSKAPGKLLEKAKILCSDDFSGGSLQIRIGTPEVTRRGMKEEEMDYIAELFKRVLIDKEDVDKVAKDVEEFVARYQGLEFAFK